MRELQTRGATTMDDLIFEVMESLNVIDYGIIANVYERDPDGGGMCNGLYADTRLLDGLLLTNAAVRRITGTLALRGLKYPRTPNG
ncbi:MAG: hypothetical protein LBG43_06555 [Treponema sp.]|nr:hypothetical protein [Treponema sp.]